MLSVQKSYELKTSLGWGMGSSFSTFFFFFLVGLIEGCAPFEAFFGEWGTNVSKLAHNSQKWFKKKKKMSEMGLNC